MRVRGERRLQNSNFGLVAKSQGGKAGLFFKEVGEMGQFLEAKAPGDLGDIPVRLFQEDLCLLDDAAGDKFGCRPAHVLF